MRSLTSAAFSAALLAIAVQATAGDGIQMPLSEAFNYSLNQQEAFQQDTAVAGVSYLSSCCDEPSCECPCDCGDASCCDDCDGCGCGDECGCGDCCGGYGCGSCKKKAAAPNPCAASHKGLFYANDFSYLNDPCYRGNCLGDCMKQIDTCTCGPGKLDIGGQLRFRYHSENSMGGGTPAFDGSQNDFLLTRLRLYTNWKINDWARFYAEGIVADVAEDEADYVPRGIDRNYGDFLNLFFDIKLTDSTTFRVGRQELLYGSQRHISPLDWANTRRTFEGVKMMYKKGDLAVDAFYTNFVPVNANQFDEADYDRSFYGVYATYTGSPYSNYDLFYIGFDDERAGSITADFSVHTFGGRIYGGSGDWLWDMEMAYQTGRQSGLGVDHRAGMCTCGLGRKLDMCWSPTVWLYYDYASGNDMDGGSFNRYNQLFPLAHKYLGFADFVARSNISSPNVLVTMAPNDKWKLLFWYYYIGAAVDGDIVPGVASAVPAGQQDPTSDDFLQELDIIAKRTLGPRSNILFGYSNVWAGSKVINPIDSDANFFYCQWELNF